MDLTCAGEISVSDGRQYLAFYFPCPFTVPAKSSYPCVDFEAFQHTLCSDDERLTRVLARSKSCQTLSLFVPSIRDVHVMANCLDRGLLEYHC